MIDYTIQNKKAWEYNAYEFWVKESGMPADLAKKIVANPRGALKRYANYFETYKCIRVANICGSCGKKAVPLALLGSEVTVFDISEDNKRYALELADAAGVQIDCQVCDVLEIDMAKFGGTFDVVSLCGNYLLLGVTDGYVTDDHIQHIGCGVEIYMTVPDEQIVSIYQNHIILQPTELTAQPWGDLAFEVKICGYQFMIAAVQETINE